MTTPRYYVRLGIAGTLQPLWEVRLSDRTLIAGLCAGAQGILFELYLLSGTTYVIDTNADIEEHRLLSEYAAEFIAGASLGKLDSPQEKGSPKGTLKGTPKGVWLRSYALYRYSLYRFNNAAFLQGVISICNYFQVDFRNYLYGLPFDAYGNLYTLSGYSLLSYAIAQDIREDPYADCEDWDDENIIQPYNSTDELITRKEVNSIASLDADNYENGFLIS